MIFVWLWHNLLSSMTSSSIHFPINVITLFSDLSKNYVAYAHHFLFICSSTHGHPGWLRSLATVKSAAVHDVQVSLCCADIESFGHVPRCGITGSHYRYIFRDFLQLFYFLFFWFYKQPSSQWLPSLPRKKANQCCKRPNTEGGSWNGYEKQKEVPCSWIGRTDSVEMDIPAKVAYRLNTIPIKTPMAILTENQNLSLLPRLVMNTDSSLSCGERGCLSICGYVEVKGWCLLYPYFMRVLGDLNLGSYLPHERFYQMAHLSCL